MFNIKRLVHERHGAVIQIERINADGLTSFQAVQSAHKEIRLWLEEGISKVRVLIDEQVMSIIQAESWAIEEYKSMEKCPTCYQVLNGNLYKNQLHEKYFCSQKCADEDYSLQIEKILNEEEIEFR